MARSTTSSTINLFLTGIALCYFWAFLSLYPQIPGLYGPTGILPIHRLHKDHYSKSCLSMDWKDITQNPSFFCLVNDLQICPVFLMELFCLIGIILSVLCILSHFIRHNLTFLIFFSLWSLYLSLYLVGQTFLSFQWDILLLECGFLCCFITSSSIYSRYNDIILFLVRWLLFRLMFASFMVKLQSKCATWWGLTALDWHYESTCIPTPASWYFHHLPNWFNHISVIIMYIIEGPFAILFILPSHFGSQYILRYTRLLAAYSNIILMILIQFSGNYNFFNMLTIVITCSCFDDLHIEYIKSKLFFWRKSTSYHNPQMPHKYVRWLLHIIEILLWVGFIATVVHYFDLSVEQNTDVLQRDGWYGSIVNTLDRYHVHSEIKFSQEWLNITASKFLLVAVIFAYINLMFSAMSALITDFGRFCAICCGRYHPKDGDTLSCCTVLLLFIIFIYRLVCYAIKMMVGIFIFHISLVPFLNAIDGYHYTQQYVLSRSSMDYIRDEWYSKSHSFHLVSSYGLFRRMTGVGARPELEIFVSGDTNPLLPFEEKHILLAPSELRNVSTMPWDKNEDDSNKGWYRVPFLYKPGDLDSIPGWIAPHQPRLDWQMWFAALGNYQNNAWFISFLYRLITIEQSTAVYDLIDSRRYIYAPNFVNHLKWKQAQNEKEKQSSAYSLADGFYDTMKKVVNDWNVDNEFANFMTKEDYYKTCKKKECKKKKKRKQKKRKRRREKKKNKHEKLFEIMDYGYPKYITAILYDYHYSDYIETEAANVCLADAGSGTCKAGESTANDINKGIWWKRERKREYFPVVKYDKLDNIRDWMKKNGFLKRPVFDGESELSQVVKYVRIIRNYYRRLYHLKFDVVGVIHGFTIIVLSLRFVHEIVQNECCGRALS